MIKQLIRIITISILSIQLVNANSLTEEQLQWQWLSKKLKKEKTPVIPDTVYIEKIIYKPELKSAEKKPEPVVDIKYKDTKDFVINDINDDVSSIFAEQLDSLYQSWIITNTYDNKFYKDNRATGIRTPINYPDKLYIDRLQSIDSYINLSFNNTVKGIIELYTQRRPGTAETVLGLSTYYFPMIEAILDKYGLPHELKYMAIIESALNPTAKSHAGATGLWQFMFQTGKLYGLQVDTYIDERCDPIKATDAAARHLQDLYNIYNDWHLAIAAYNCGAGNVNKAISRSGGKRDYWEIYYRLPKETRGYVPAFIAAAYFMNFHQEHKLSPKHPDFPILTDTIMVDNYLNFEQISKVLNIPIQEISALNPKYKINIIPAQANKKYSLRLPINKINSFIENRDSIFSYRRNEYFPDNSIKTPDATNNSNYYTNSNSSEENKIQYTVKQGDVIGRIAEKYNVKVSDIRRWNKISGNTIKIGQKLTIYVASNKNEQNTRIAPSPQSKAKSESTNNEEWTYYTVRSGDTLFSIANKFNGVSVDNIKTNNSLASDSISIGQRLKIVKY